MLQGQAWRWAWVTEFMGILFLAPTLLALWRDEHIGICATILVVAAWTLPAIGGSACLTAALLLALRRDRIGARPALYLRWAAVGLGAVVVAWQIRTQWVPWPRPTRTATEPLPMALMRQILGLQILCGMLVGLLHHWIGTRRSWSSLAVICGALFAMSAFSLPAVCTMRAGMEPRRKSKNSRIGAASFRPTATYSSFPRTTRRRSPGSLCSDRAI